MAENSVTEKAVSHTPGPWHVARQGDPDLPFAVMAGTYYVATPHLYVPGSSPEANARLIAAAPDLLEALKAVVYQFGPWHDEICPGDDTCDCGAKPVHDAVNAAIRKAEGRA